MSYEQDYKDMVAEFAADGATWFKTLTKDEQNKLVAAKLLAESKQDYLCFLTQQSDLSCNILLLSVAEAVQDKGKYVALAAELVYQTINYFAPFIDEDLKAAAVADEYARGSVCEEC